MSLAAEGPSRTLWPALWKLMRLRVLIMVSGFRRASTRAKVGTAVVGLLVVSFLVFVFVVSLGLLSFLRSPRLAAIVPEMPSLLASVPVVVMEAGFLVTLLTSFGVLLQALYLAGDMDFLLSAPVPIRAVFASKLLQAILPNLALFSLVALPVLYGLGASAGYNPLYYLLVPALLIALAVAAAGLASLVVMAVVRIFPARRVAEILGFAGALVSLVCSQSGQLARGSEVSAGQAASALRLVARFDVAWSPLAWAGRGLMGIAEGHWLPGLSYTVLALGTASLAFTLALTTAERLYYSGWAATRAVAHRKKAPHRPRRAAAAPLAGVPHSQSSPLAGLARRYLPPAVGAVMVKDWTMLRRDLRHLSQLVTPLVLGVVYAVMLFRNGGTVPPGRGGAPAGFTTGLQSIMAYGGVAISLFVGWTLLQRLAAMGFSQEGRSYWMLKSAPVSTGGLLAAKFLAAYLPALALGWGFVAFLALLQRGGPALSALWFSLAVDALCLGAVTGIYLAFGVAGARMDWEDPRQMIGGGIGCLAALSTGLALLVGMALFAGPQLLLAFLGWPLLAGQLVGLALGGAFCLACAFVPPWLVRGRVPRLGEG